MGEVVVQGGGGRRHRDHEAQVEEQLQRGRRAVLLVGVPARHRSVPRDGRDAAHPPGEVLRPSTTGRPRASAGLARVAGVRPGGLLAQAHGDDLAAGGGRHGGRVGAVRRCRVRRRPGRRPRAEKPVCSLYSVRSMERHWLSSTCSAVTSSLTCGHVTTARTWLLAVGGGAQRAGGGRVARRVGVGVGDQAGLGGVRHRGAQVGRHLGLHRLERLGLRVAPAAGDDQQRSTARHPDRRGGLPCGASGLLVLAAATRHIPPQGRGTRPRTRGRLDSGKCPCCLRNAALGRGCPVACCLAHVPSNRAGHQRESLAEVEHRQDAGAGMLERRKRGTRSRAHNRRHDDQPPSNAAVLAVDEPEQDSAQDEPSDRSCQCRCPLRSRFQQLATPGRRRRAARAASRGGPAQRSNLESRRTNSESRRGVYDGSVLVSGR